MVNRLSSLLSDPWLFYWEMKWSPYQLQVTIIFSFRQTGIAHLEGNIFTSERPGQVCHVCVSHPNPTLPSADHTSQGCPIRDGDRAAGRAVQPAVLSQTYLLSWKFYRRHKNKFSRMVSVSADRHLQLGLEDHPGSRKRWKNRGSWTGEGEKNTAGGQRNQGEHMGWRTEKENKRIRGKRWRDRDKRQN